MSASAPIGSHTSVSRPAAVAQAQAQGDLSAGLSRRRKAALIVQLLLNDGKRLPVSRMSQDVQVDLARELGAIRLVDRGTLRAVAEEFLSHLENTGLAIPGGVENALEALGADLSPEALDRARSELAATRGSDPWAGVKDLDVPDLVRLMNDEATETAAICLSKLSVKRAADVLAALPGERAQRIAYAVSRTSGIAPGTVARIGAALSAQYCTRPQPVFANPPVQRVGAILNSSPPETRDAVLEGLGAEDPDFAALVRRAIFTFSDIPARVAAVDVPKVLRGVDPAVLVTALAYSATLGGEDDAAADFILGNISQRMADSLREEIAERGKIRKKDGEEAQGLFVAAIRDGVAAGEITLIETEQEGDEGATA